jgi:hypothetical protein
MNDHPPLPKGHTSILSPQFRYVPAACTDLAATFARIRGERMQPQPLPGDSGGRQRSTGAYPEFEIEVLEAAWLTTRPAGSGKRG